MKTKNDSAKITLNNENDNDFFIPAKMYNQYYRYDLTLRNNKIAKLFAMKDCRFYVYTIAGTEIELKRKK